MGLTDLKSRYQEGYNFSGGSRREFMSLSFADSRGHLNALTCGPSLHLQSQHVSMILTLLTPFITYKDSFDYIGPIQIIKDNLTSQDP